MEAAVTYYLRGHAHRSAARTLVRLAPSYIEEGRVEALQRYLDDLPETVQREFPMLLVYRGDASDENGAGRLGHWLL